MELASFLIGQPFLNYIKAKLNIMKLNCYKKYNRLNLTFPLFGFFAVLSLIGMGSAPRAYGQVTDPSPYCNVSASECNSFFEPSITEVQVGSFSNTSACNNERTVTYFNNLQPINAPRGQQISGSITVESYSFNDHGVGIWIDFNGDGAFSPSEQVHQSELPGGTSIHNFSFTVPNDAKANCITRMRVKTDENTLTPPDEACEMSSFFGDGEVEDYDMNIGPATSQDDIGITSINKPAAGKGSYKFESLEIMIRNNGGKITAGTTIPFYYNTPLYDNPRKASYTVQQDLEGCDAVNVELPDINMACPGKFNLEVWSAWSPDVNRGNDTFSQGFLNNGNVIVDYGFERGLPSGWRLGGDNGGTVGTSNGPIGNRHWFSSGDVTNYVEFTLNVSNLANPYLYFYSQGFGAPEIEGGDGLFISVDGGANFTRISTLNIAANTGSYNEEFKLNLLKVLKANGLSIPSSGEIVIRFGHEDTIGGEGVAYDDIRVIDYPETNPVPKPTNTCFAVPDTIFVNSPTDLRSLYGKESAGYEWIINGKTVATNEITTTYEFSRSPNNTQDTIELVTYGCFGADTCKEVVNIYRPSTTPNTEFVAEPNQVDPNTLVSFDNLTTKGATNFTWDIRPRSNAVSPFTFVWNSNNTNQPIRALKPTARMLQPGFYDVELVSSNAVGLDTLVKERYLRVRNNVSICDETFTTDSIGYIQDGNDIGYPSDANCNYLIQPCGNNIRLNFEQFDLKKGEGFLRVYDGQDATGKPLWNTAAYGSKGLTGDTTNQAFMDTIVANSGSVYIEFASGSDPVGDGFSLEWNANTQSIKPLTSDIKGDTTVCPGFSSGYAGSSNFSNSTFKWTGSSAIDFPNGSRKRVVEPTFPEQPGTYNLTLITKQCGRADTVTQNVVVQQPTQSPSPDFTADKRIGQTDDTFKLNEITESCVKGRQWSILPNTYKYVNGTNSESKNPVVVFSKEGAYRISLTDTIVGGLTGQTTKPGFITINDYCIVGASTVNPDIGINSVSLNNLSFTSPVSQGGYADYSENSTIAEVSPNSTNKLTVKRNSTFNSVYYGVWVDFNNDGEFTGSNELIGRSQRIFGNTWQTNIDIPGNVSFGTYRMRIGATATNSANTPCGEKTVGEYEDYTIRVSADDEAPSIITQGGDTVMLQACGSVQPYLNAAYAQDNVDGRIDDIQITNGVDTANPGVYSVSYQARDQAGNAVSKEQIFRITPDDVKPMFTLQGPDTLVLGVNQPYTEPGFTGLKDQCSGIDEFNIDSTNLNNQSLGSYAVTYEAIDGSGNVAVEERIVNVRDTVKPSFTLADGSSIVVPVETKFEDPGLANVSDNFWASDEILVESTNNVDPTKPGEYRVRYAVTDGSGNTRVRVRNVTVEDVTAPTVSTTGSDDTLVVEVNDRLLFRDQISATDNFSSPSLVDTSGSFYLNFPDGIPNVLGVYDLSLTYEDNSGNSTDLVIAVKVVDRTAPEISLVGPDYYSIDRWETSQYADASGVTVEDNYYNEAQTSVTLSGSYFDTYIADSFVTGIFEIRYQAEDPSGNQSEIVTRTVEAVQPAATGIDEESSESAVFEVYPNPTSGVLQIKTLVEQRQDAKLEIINAYGKVVRVLETNTVGSNTYQINLEKESSGIYFLQMTANDQVKTERFILTK
jgi:hypothetical protein